MFYSSLSLVNIWQQEKTLERKKGERCNKGLRWFKPENKLLLHSRIWGIYCHVHFHTRETLKLHSNTHLTICSIHVRLLRHKKVQHQTKLMKSSDSQLVGYCQKKFNFNRLCCSPKLNFMHNFTLFCEEKSWGSFSIQRLFSKPTWMHSFWWLQSWHLQSLYTELNTANIWKWQ